jgi:hypothetical protein
MPLHSININVRRGRLYLIWLLRSWESVEWWDRGVLSNGSKFAFPRYGRDAPFLVKGFCFYEQMQIQNTFPITTGRELTNIGRMNSQSTQYFVYWFPILIDE